MCLPYCFFFISSRRRHTRWPRDWSSDVCSSDLIADGVVHLPGGRTCPVAPMIGCIGVAAADGEMSTVMPSYPTGGNKIGRASCRERRGGQVGDGCRIDNIQ